MISVQGLVKRYGPVTAVDGLDFEVRSGEVVAFLGPNGAGKTTTFRILAGFLRPTAGRALLDGVDASERPIEAQLKLGYLPEDNPLYEEMEVSEFLDWAAELRGARGAARRAQVRRAAERCGLGPVLGRAIGTLSKGYRQRVGLAQAIVHDPPILLLDEPTSGLDPIQAREVRALLKELKASKTLLVSTHILPEAEALADRVLILRRGRLAADGPAGQLSGGGPRTVLVLKAGRLALEKTCESIRGLRGVRRVEGRKDGGEAVFEVSGEGDLREPLFKLAVESGWHLLELRREAAGLEEIFHELAAGGDDGR